MVNSLLLATIFRIGFVVISYGAKVPAGIFVPSMAIGATFGRMIGIIVKAMYRSVDCQRFFAQLIHDLVAEPIQILAFLRHVNLIYLVLHLEHTLSLVLQLL